MTIQKHTNFRSGFAPSTTPSASQSFNAEGTVSLVLDNSSIAGAGSYRKSRDGKIPRLVERAAAESQDTGLRSQMQEARIRLANDFMGDEQPSLTSIRLKRGYSQQQLAKQIGTSQPHIANLEAGKIDPQFGTVCRLADALGLSLDEIRPHIESVRKRSRNNVA